MSKELLWSEDMDFVYGWEKDFENKTDFINTVKKQYEDGECDVINIKIEPCIATEKGIMADKITPLALTDIVIENFYTAQIEPIKEDQIMVELEFCPECGGELILLDNGNFPEYYEEWLECEKCGFVKDVD